MNDFLKNLLIGDNGSIYIVDQNGNLISSSIDMDHFSIDNGQINLINTNEIDNQYIQKSKEAYQDRKGKTIPTIEVDGQKYYVNRTEINHKNINWQAYYLIAENDFLANIKRASLYTILLLIVFIILSIRITFYIAEKIGTPIEELSKAAEKISSGAFEEIGKEGKIKEIDSLTKSLNKSGKALASLIADLEGQVQERTIELEMKNKMLKSLSYLDGLTEICNRRKFDESCLRAWASAIRLGNSVAIIMIDIDDFKKYNDHYGHIKGDEALKLIAQELQKNLRRSTDLLARYGGEEFIVLIEGIEKVSLGELAQNLRKSVENLKIDHETSEFKYVTISLGYSHVYPSMDLDKNELIDRADQALYKAKLAGKNKAIEG